MVISGFCDLDLDLQTDNLGILSRYFNILMLCSIFLRKKLNITELKTLVNEYCQYFQLKTKNIKISLTLTLTLK